MNTFIFQSTPDRYDLSAKLVPGNHETWYATRYRSEMHKNDIVFFWMAGDEKFRGLYGWGNLISVPYIKEAWQSHGVDIQYKVKFAKPILAKTIRDDSELADLLIFRAPQATNFLLDQRKARRLIALIAGRGEEIPALSGAGK